MSTSTRSRTWSGCAWNWTAAGTVSTSVGRLICLWTDRLPEKFRDESDELLVAAAQAGLGAEDTRTQDQRYHDALQEAMRSL